MALAHSPKIITDGLVFAYDMGNTQKSWKGAPVTNLAVYTDYSNRNYDTLYDIGGFGGDDADVFYYKNGGYNNLPYKKMVKHTGGTGGSYINEHSYFTLVEGKTYIITCYMKSNAVTTVSGHTLALNRDADNTYRVPADIALTTDWVKQSWTYTCAVGEGGTTYHFRQIVYNDTSLPVEVYWCGLQIAEGTISYPYVNGARSNTQAIIDLTGNNTLTASNLTYNVNGTFSFNNTSSVITMPDNPALNPTTALSIETWVKFNGDSDDFIFEKGDVNSQYSLFSHSSDIAFRTFHSVDGTFHTQNPAKSTIGVVNGIPVHIICSWDGSTKRIYINGVLKDSVAKTGVLITRTTGAAIGRFGGTSTGYYFGGDIYKVAVYNKALSDSEVQQNFNALRGRYGV